MKHDLRRVWKKFKRTYPTAHLSALDPAIKRLNKFEEIRYPDKVLEKGMLGTWNLQRAHVIAGVGQGDDFYPLVLEDIDEMVKLIFQVASVNPPFFLNHLGQRATAILQEENLHPLLFSLW